MCPKGIMPGVLAAAGTLLVLSAGLAIEPAEQLREEFHQTYPLSADGRVSLKNVNGKVRITGWDRNEVKVDAIKTAESREVLDNTQIEVDSRPDSIAIRTKSRNERDLGVVDFTLAVPRGAHLDGVHLVNGSLEVEEVNGDIQAKTVNGAITARGLRGQVDLASVNGRVESGIERLDTAKPVSVKTVNGALELTLPSDAGAQLSARTVHGGLESDFDITVRSTGFRGHSLEGRLGQGGAPVRLETVNGGIRIRRASAAR